MDSTFGKREEGLETTAIDAQVLTLLRTVVTKFVVEVMERALLLRQQELQMKEDTRTWRVSDIDEVCCCIQQIFFDKLLMLNRSLEEVLITPCGCLDSHFLLRQPAMRLMRSRATKTIWLAGSLPLHPHTLLQIGRSRRMVSPPNSIPPRHYFYPAPSNFHNPFFAFP